MPKHESHNLDAFGGIAVAMVLVCDPLRYFGVTPISPCDVRWWSSCAFLFFFVHISRVLMLELERREVPSLAAAGVAEPNA